MKKYIEVGVAAENLFPDDEMRATTSNPIQSSLAANATEAEEDIRRSRGLSFVSDEFNSKLLTPMKRQHKGLN